MKYDAGGSGEKLPGSATTISRICHRIGRDLHSTNEDKFPSLLLDAIQCFLTMAFFSSSSLFQQWESLHYQNIEKRSAGKIAAARSGRRYNANYPPLQRWPSLRWSDIYLGRRDRTTSNRRCWLLYLSKVTGTPSHLGTGAILIFCYN